MREIPFRKMHGLGNDFVVIDARDAPVELTPAQIKRIANRRRGIGFDQLVRIDPSQNADARLTFFNADGSEAGACGNATRCISRLLLLDNDRQELALETRGGRLVARRRLDGLVTVEMATPKLDWRDIPLARACDTLHVPIDEPGLPNPVAVSMGNPHAVFFIDDVDMLDVEALGGYLERHPIFPERANIGFAELADPKTIRLRVFERGAGVTLACGTGACAAMVAAHRLGLVGDSVTVLLDGGPLEISWPGEGPVVMTGPAAFVFEGRIAAELLDE